MVPAPYTTLAAVLFAAGGLLTCFAGYRLFRVVLGLYGFILGAMIGSNIPDPGNTWAIAMCALGGGVAGAVLLVLAYFVGVGLIGAGLAALALNALWRVIGGEPPTLILVIVCVIGAVLALNAQRYVVIFGTAIAGSWTAIVGGMALLGQGGPFKAASAPNVWVIYPMNLLPGGWTVTLLWFVIAIAGVIVQLSTSSKTGKRKAKPTKAA
jgi:hypothetical protein